MRNGAIYRYAPTVCNRSNNTVADMSQGILNIRITITPVYPADFIRVSLINDITENFNLTL
jgi:phage tail sheath protein FI